MATSPWLLVGLGNPGPEYAKNRHNVGFMVVERFVERHVTPGAGGPSWKSQFKGRVASIQAEPPIGRCVVLEPQTYMNRSGESVRAAVDFYEIPIERIAVVHDEIDFELGRIGLKCGGGHGGHNGLRDLIKHLGSPDFLRVRLGVGRPQLPSHGEVSDWVLSNFSEREAAFADDLVARGEEALTCLLAEGLAAAMRQFHRSPDADTGRANTSTTFK